MSYLKQNNGIKTKPIDAAEKIRIQVLTRQIFNESNGSAGTRTIRRKVLSTQESINVTRYMACKLMHELDLENRQYKKLPWLYRDNCI